jgi:hypothetical protein
MDVPYCLWTRQHQQVVVSLQGRCVISESLASIIVLFESKSLDHGAHGTIQQQNTLLQERTNVVHVRSLCSWECKTTA